MYFNIISVCWYTTINDDYVDNDSDSKSADDDIHDNVAKPDPRRREIIQSNKKREEIQVLAKSF